MLRSLVVAGILLCGFPLEAAALRTCVASAPLGTLELSVQPAQGGTPLPISRANVIQPGQKLLYRPVQIPSDDKKARLALVLVSASGNDQIQVLDPQPANKSAEWIAPFRVSVVGMAFGPQGLDRKKVNALVKKDHDLIVQMADYAEQTARVESLISALMEADQGPSAGKNVDAALNGFAKQYGLQPTKLDRTAPTDQQALTLMRALNPALGAYDPLAPQPATRMQQSAGLAASVAGLFFGSPVGLAAGGAAMAQNLRTLLFPDTDFRSALVQPSGSDSMLLCAKRQPAKSRTRTAYLWAHRVPDVDAPKVSVETVHLPVGTTSAIPAKSSDWKYLGRARNWELVPSAGGKPVPAWVKPAADTQALEIDLRKTAAAPGSYHLAAKWDWDAFQVAGDVNVHALPDLKDVCLASGSRDRLIEGAGPVTIKLTGADFEFLEKAELERRDGRKSAPVPLEFTLPRGKRNGPQDTAEIQIDTGSLKRGMYQLCLYQPGGKVSEVPLRVLPPNPKILNLPINANVGEKEQKIVLRGSGLERIEAVLSKAAQFQLAAATDGQQEREAALRLDPDLRAGERAPLELKVEGMEAPLEIPGGLQVIGPRPRIELVKGSWPDDLGVVLREGELPAASFVSFSMRVENLDPQPAVRLECLEPDKNLRSETLHPGEKSAAARLEMAGTNVLFLSLNPGSVGQAGCSLSAAVVTSTGGSDPRTLGRVVRLPRIDSFTLTSEKLNEDAYVGILTGQDLETIGKVGWDAQSGLPVDNLPKPLAGEGQKQSLRVALKWPSPAPHAPVYIWLRGENEGRATKARY